MTPAFKVAIVGAGPAGFYSAAALLKQQPAAEVSLIERLASPYGLVRYGVAPDHASLKAVTAIFERIGRDPRVSFFGNTQLWRDISLAELMASHQAVILAIGASEDRTLGLAESPVRHLYAASQIVGWYNGHPDYWQFTPDFGTGRVCIFGHGNVAVDLARILLCPPERLATTDIPHHSLELLRSAPVREVHLVGRRGPTETRFSAPVIAELLDLPGVEVLIDITDPPASSEAELIGSPPVSLAMREVTRILEAAAHRTKVACSRKLFIHFWSTPEAIRLSNGGLDITLARRHATGHSTRHLQVDAAVTATGFQLGNSHGNVLPVNAGALANRSGRVLDASGAIIAGLYAVGWAARGASGTIGTCRSEAERLMALILADEAAIARRGVGGSNALSATLHARQHRSVDFEQWLRLDQLERSNGAAAGRSRLKFPTTDQMLSSLDSLTAQNTHRALTDE